LRTARRSEIPVRFHAAYAAAATISARTHHASRKSHGTSEVAPYQKRTRPSAAAP